MSIRARLTLGLIVLAAIGVVTVDVVNYTSMRTFLLERADQSLDTATRSVTTTLEAQIAAMPGEESVNSFLTDAIPSLVGSIPGSCIQIRTPKDRILGARCLAQFPQAPLPPDPVYPARVSAPPEDPATGNRVRYLTVPAAQGGGNYRVRLSVERPLQNYYLLLATPLDGVESTLHRLLVIESLVSGGVLIALALLGLWFARFGLKPLESIGRTATAVAGGDLSQRFEHVDENTEVGRLGLLLNTMLGQIQAAFQTREAALEARAASEAKLRRFVADASHELRTPVSAVRAYAELFSHGAADRPEDLERTMQGVKQASERMSALVDELFLLAHLDEGRALAREAVDLESIVTEAVEVAKAVEPQRPFTVETRSTVVIGDASRLRQLVDNLLSNVRAHTPPETPVTVTLEHSEEDAVLRVADFGPGIDRASVPHVFERFFRADFSHGRAGGGSGLGLAIVAALAEAHGGSATASSEVGEGATFTITLPLAKIEGGDGVPDSPRDAEGQAAVLADRSEH
jgi:two-component system OmpR family sensor kinase